jgi:hypothetical protein
MDRQALKNSVEVLKILYMVVAGLAIADGLKQFLVNESGQFKVELVSLETLFVIIFATTVVRFVHGAMRHFDRNYSEQPETVNWRMYQPIADFIGLGMEAGIFFILAYSLDNQWRFMNYYLILLIVDCVWLSIISLPNWKRRWTKTRRNWTLANLFVLVLTGGPILFFNIRGIAPYPSWLLWVFIGTVAAHTLVDYPLNWEVYFGRPFQWPWSRSQTRIETLFLAGAYWSSDPNAIDKNIQLAEQYSIELWNRGYKVVSPHLNTRNFEVKAKAGEEAYKELDMRILQCCDAVFALPNWKESAGAGAEIDEAKRLWKPIFYSLDKLPARG